MEIRQSDQRYLYVRRLAMGIAVSALCVACENGVSSGTAQATDSEPKPAQTAEIDHRATGLAAAESAWPGLASLCGDPSRPLTPQRVGSREWSMPRQVPPARVFDNLMFVGNAATTAWVIETGDGLVLIDALWHPEEAKSQIEGGLTALGLDPADIKVMVLSHGHGDHTGGARYLHDKYGMDVVMGTPDWEFVSDPDSGYDFPGWRDIPQPDILVSEPEIIELGGTSIKIAPAPGHTMGTLSTTFSVTENGETHNVVIWGGTGFNFGPKPEQYQAYATSADDMYNRVLSENISVFLSNHVRRDGTDTRLAALEQRAAGDPHPFVDSKEKISKAFVAFRECALAQLNELSD